MNTEHTSVDAYIDGFPKGTQKILKQLRTLVKKTATGAQESIAYGMPAYKLNRKPIVYFAGYDKHIGFYATPTGHEKFAKELSNYKQGKGSVQFPLNKPMPMDLIERIVKFRIAESESTAKPAKKAAAKKVIANKAAAKRTDTSDAVISKDIHRYNGELQGEHRVVAILLAEEITLNLPDAENKLWHGHPVWFLDGNPIVGYSKQKPGMRLMFWSGADFDEKALDVKGEKFKDASIFYNDVDEVKPKELKRWFDKSRKIQWDYKNIVKRKGRLERLK
jgi:uncharacterized protein YdhG (YjbR/CyaY superfamily)